MFFLLGRGYLQKLFHKSLITNKVRAILIMSNLHE
jgi:hypothetical protein